MAIDATDTLKLQAIFDKISTALSDEEKKDLLAILQKLLSYQLPGVAVEDLTEQPSIEDTAAANVKDLIGYVYEASDNPQHIGEYLVQLPQNFNGKIASVSVDAVPYTYGKIYQQREIWYGPPGCENIQVILNDGSIYRAELTNTSDILTTEKPYHHYNPAAWHGQGSAIVLCPGQSADSVTVAGRSFRKHGSLDRGREVWTDYHNIGLHGEVVMKSGSKTWRFRVKGDDMQRGDCW